VVPRAEAAQRYASQVGAVWTGLAATLLRLEALAAEPERLADDGALSELGHLQYAIHSASEDLRGLTPPADGRPGRDELASALALAREATGELVEAIELEGAEAAQPLIYEWRGALFRIRLARQRLEGPESQSAGGGERRGLRAPAVAVVLALGGTAVFVLGATSGSLPLWASGAAAVCASLLVYRP
jgi:hypothetical protein